MDKKIKNVKPTVFSNGVSIINVTPHDLTFLDIEKVVTVPTSGFIVNAEVEETIVKEGTPILVTTKFVADEENKDLVKNLKEAFPDTLLVGSIIAAQAFVGDVAAMTPAPGFERVPPQEKRMSTQKFTIFNKCLEGVTLLPKYKTLEE